MSKSKEEAVNSAKTMKGLSGCCEARIGYKKNKSVDDLWEGIKNCEKIKTLVIHSGT